jgi:hypothetical protein
MGIGRRLGGEYMEVCIMRTLGLRLILGILAVSSGCTAMSLSRRTVDQGNTYADVIYRQVMENLAMVANNPEVLPSYSLIDFGTTDITDKVGLAGVLTIPPANGAISGSIDPSGSRAIKQNWTLTPVVAPEKLRALHMAFAYAVYRDPHLLTVHDHRISLDVFRYPYSKSGYCVPLPPASADVRCGPSFAPGEPGFYFGVADDLASLDTCWLHVSAHADVPKCARLQAHCGNKYLWVNGEDLGAMSKFTLIIQQVARQVVADAYYPKPDAYTFYTPVPVFWSCPQMDARCPLNDRPIQSQCTCYMLPVTLPVDCYGNVIAQKVREEGIQTTDKKLNSSLNASAKGP